MTVGAPAARNADRRGSWNSNAPTATVAFTMSRLSHRRRTAIRIALALSTAIAVTRVIVGAHYPTDVIGGLILGVVVAQITALGSDLATQLPTREPHA